MALWIMEDAYPSYEALNEDTNVDTQLSNAIDAYNDQPDWNVTNNEIAGYGQDVLPIALAIIEKRGEPGSRLVE